jgi:hypothetical protein
MPAKKITLKPAVQALTKIQKELKNRKKKAPPSETADLDQELNSVEQAIKTLTLACHGRYSVG